MKRSNYWSRHTKSPARKRGAEKLEADSEKQLWDIECCSGNSHTVREGGSHINIVVLDKKAPSKYMAAYDFWLDGKERPPRASAVLCDRCLKEGRAPLFALARDGDDTPIYRIPVAELEDWSCKPPRASPWLFPTQPH